MPNHNGIYADQRIGEILRELPTRQGKRNDLTSVDTPTKVEAERDAGIGHATAIDLQKLAANPDVVQAVLDKLAEGIRRQMAIESEKAKERSGVRTDLRQTFATGESGRARDKAAEQFGISGEQARKTLYVADNSDLLDPAICQRLEGVAPVGGSGHRPAASIGPKFTHRVVRKGRRRPTAFGPQTSARDKHRWWRGCWYNCSAYQRQLHAYRAWLARGGIMGAISVKAAEHHTRQEQEQPVTPSAQEALGLLERHDRSGWVLSELTTAELAAIDAAAVVVSDARPLQEREVGSPTSELLHRCHEAMRQERARRDLAYQREIDQQRRRVENIIAASRRIEDAARLLEQAEAVEDRRAELLPRPTIEAIDPGTMTDAELQRIIGESERAAQSYADYAESMNHVADVLSAVKDPRFRAHAKTAMTIADEAVKDASAHRARIEAARAELADRAERDRQEQEANAPAKTMDVQALAARVAELEAALADK